MTNNISFTGFHYAQCKGLTQKGRSCLIDFYKITKTDEKLIESLSKLKQGNLGTPIIMATGNARKSTEAGDVFVAVCENKPIGIVSGAQYLDESINQPYYYIHAVASWGKDKHFFSKERKNKVLNAGKGLMNLMYQTAQAKNINKVKLTSINDSALFYKKNGFALDKNSIKGKYLLLTAREMSCDLTPEFMNKNINDIDFKVTNSNNDVSLDTLDTALNSSGLQDYLRNKLNAIKTFLKADS